MTILIISFVISYVLITAPAPMIMKVFYLIFGPFSLILRWIGKRSPEKHSPLLLSVGANVIRTTAATTTAATVPECQEPHNLLVAGCSSSRPSRRCIKRHNTGSHKRGKSESKVRSKGCSSQICRVCLQFE